MVKKNYKAKKKIVIAINSTGAKKIKSNGNVQLAYHLKLYITYSESSL